MYKTEDYSEGLATNMSSYRMTLSSLKLESDGTGLWLYGKNSDMFRTSEEGPNDGYFQYAFFDSTIDGENFDASMEKAENKGIMSLAFAREIRLTISGGHLKKTHFGMSKLIGLIFLEARYEGTSFVNVEKIPFLEVFSKNLFSMSSSHFNRTVPVKLTMNSSIITVLSFDCNKIDQFSYSNPSTKITNTAVEKSKTRSFSKIFF